MEKGGFALTHIYVERAFRFQKESLNLLGITDEQIISAQTFAAVKTPQLVIPSIPVIPTAWACHFLRDRITPEAPNPHEALYSRADASRRRIINEEEVMALLNRYGFQS